MLFTRRVQGAFINFNFMQYYQRQKGKGKKNPTDLAASGIFFDPNGANQAAQVC